MSTDGVDGVFNSDFKIKLQNRGPKLSGITWELKSIFTKMAEDGLISDTDSKGFTEQDALNLYKKLDEIHKRKNFDTNYTKMQVNQEFDYTADEMKELAKAAGYEIVQGNTEEPVAFQAQVETTAAETNVNSNEVKPSEKKEAVPVAAKQNVENSELTSTEDNTTAEFVVDGKTRRQLRRDKRLAEKDLKVKLADAPVQFISAEPEQVGRILDGKYYINYEEVTEAEFNAAKGEIIARQQKRGSL